MAGDWIKMRVGLTTNPRVMRIAECLLDDGRYMEWSGLSYGVRGYPPPSKDAGRLERHAALRVTRYVTVTALLRFWGYANEHAKGEFIAGIFPEDVEEITGVPGFAEAIESAGWVQFEAGGGMTMPNFHEHNTSAGERSGAAERQKRYREKAKGAGVTVTPNSDVTRDVTVTPREEKRREEKKKEQELTNPSGLVVASKLAPPCPQSEIVALYHEALPNLPGVREWTDARQALLRKRWSEKPERQTLDWWRDFFGYIAKSDFLCGRSRGKGGGKPFEANLEWITRPSNFVKIIEGNYENR